MTRAQGIDVSRYNKFFDPRQASQRIDFAIQKITESTAYTDLLINEIWQGVKQIPVRGAYHYGRSGMSWKAQADHFLNTAAKYDYHFHAYDLEGLNNVYSDTFFADVRRTLDYWKDQTGRPNVLYTNGSTYESFAAAIKRLYHDAQAWLDALEFWYSWPSLTAPAPILPAGRSTWTFWQYRWDGPLGEWGNGIPCDVNWYNGTVEELHTWAGVMSPPTEEPMPYRYKATSIYDNLRLRPDHNTNNTALTQYPAGTVFEGDNLFTAPVELRNSSGAVYQQAGDQWLEAATPRAGWVAIKHLGKLYSTLVDNGPVDPPAEKHTVEVLVDGTRQFYIEL